MTELKSFEDNVCKNCGKPIWYDSIPSRGWRHKSPGGGGSYDCYERKTAQPRFVPVERKSK